MRLRDFSVGISLLAAASASAEVVRIEVSSRETFAGGQAFGAVGAYEKVRGRLHYAVDPASPANARIVDLGRAPRDASGRVTFTGDFVLLKPVDLAKGNHRLLYEVNNRGNLGMLSRFNRAAGSSFMSWSTAPRCPHARATLGCPAPFIVSQMSSARSRLARAAGSSPLRRCTIARLIRMAATLG